MTQTIYGLISDNGDGSSSMRWYRTQSEVDHMLDEGNGHKEILNNYSDGQCPETLTFPADLDLTECGFSFATIEE